MNYLIFIVFLIINFNSLRKVLLLFPLIIIITPKALLLIQVPSIPLLSVSNGITFLLIFTFLMILLTKRISIPKKKFRFFKGFLILLISYFLVLLLSKSALTGIHTVIIQFLTSEFIFLIVF